MERSLYLIISYCSLISATLFDIEVEVDYGTWDLSFSTQQATFEGSIYNCNAEGGILAVLPSSEATIEATEQIKDHISLYIVLQSAKYLLLIMIEVYNAVNNRVTL